MLLLFFPTIRQHNLSGRNAPIRLFMQLVQNGLPQFGGELQQAAGPAIIFICVMIRGLDFGYIVKVCPNVMKRPYGFCMDFLPDDISDPKG